MNAYDAKMMVLAICDAEISSRDELCRLDSFVGDGDHGFTVERGFGAVKKLLTQSDFQTPCEVFDAVGNTLAESMGGAIGLIIGSFFMGGAKAVTDKKVVDVQEIGDFLEHGLREIKEVGGAEEGDRTLVDALSPAVSAYRKGQFAGQNLNNCLREAAIAAATGAESTANMVANKGRAKFLMEKSLGFVDAGATTMKIMLETMNTYVAQ